MFIFTACGLCQKRFEIDTRRGAPELPVCGKCSEKARNKIAQKENRKQFN